MTEDEKWEQLRINIESLHSNIHELWESAQKHDAALRELTRRMANLMDLYDRLGNIALYHDEQLEEHWKRIGRLDERLKRIENKRHNGKQEEQSG